MTIRERVAELIERGAALQVLFEDSPMITFLLAGMLWRQKRTRWCAVFPEHQGHIHETEYDRAVFVNNGRDVAFYRGEVMVLYVCPYEESGGDLSAMHDNLIEWRRLLGLYNNAEQFAEFLAEA